MSKYLINFKRSSLVFILLIITLSFLINSCGIYRPTDARKVSPNPDERVRQNIEEGKGFRLLKKNKNSGEFDFATSNELWRATLETLDFIPLTTADYGGGIIITDWYNNSDNSNESLKISIRFLTNEIRSDSILVKIFKKDCSIIENCKVSPIDNNLNIEIKLAILKKATLFKKNMPTTPYKFNDGNNK
jgi:hypothetical protein